MAIDFSRYASNYGGRGSAGGGGGGGGNPLAQGMRDIGKAMGTYREREQWARDDATYKKTKKAEAFTKWRKGYFSKSYGDTLGTGTFDSLDSLIAKASAFSKPGAGWDDQSQSWTDYQKAAKNVTIDGETYDFSQEIDAMTYANDYQKLHQSVSSQWLNKIGSLELDPNISSREIKKIMKSNPAFFNYLKTFNPDQFRVGGTYEGYTPTQTWGEWAGHEDRLFNDPMGYLNEMSGLQATGLGVAAPALLWGAPKLVKYLTGLYGAKTAKEIVSAGKNNPTIRASVNQAFNQNVTQGNLFNQTTTPGTGGRPQGVINALKKGAKEIVKNGQKFVKYADGSLKSFASFGTPGMTSQQIYGTGGGASSTSRANQVLNNLNRAAGGTKGLKQAAGQYWDDITKTWKSSMKLPAGFTPTAVNVGRGVAYAGIPFAAGYGVEKLTGNENLGEVANKGAFAAMTLTPIISGINTLIKKHTLPVVLKKIWNVGGTKLALSAIGKLGAGVLGGSVSAGAITVGMTAWALKDLYDIYKILNEEFGTNDQGNKNVLKQQNKAISQLSNNPAAMSDFSPELRAAYSNLT